VPASLKAALQKAGYFGKEAEAGYGLCEQALAIDPNNVRALAYLVQKFLWPAFYGTSADPQADFKRADKLNSRALALEPNWANLHLSQANILATQGRFHEAITESERALFLDPSVDYADENIGWNYGQLGQFEKALPYFDKSIRLSPHDPWMFGWLDNNSWAHFALKQYDQAIDLARQSIALNPNFPSAHRELIAALAFAGQLGEAREALQRYLALAPAGLRTIAGWKAFHAKLLSPKSDPRYLGVFDQMIEGLRKAGMPEGDNGTN
jgi:tetratricopeptide (TPR) repeat protein